MEQVYIDREAQLDKLQSEIAYKQPKELDFFSDESGEVQYNDKCMQCKKKCKQSYRASIKYCPRFQEVS